MGEGAFRSYVVVSSSVLCTVVVGEGEGRGWLFGGPDKVVYIVLLIGVVYTVLLGPDGVVHIVLCGPDGVVYIVLCGLTE